MLQKDALATLTWGKKKKKDLMKTDQMIKQTKCSERACYERASLSMTCILTWCWHWSTAEEDRK